MRMTMLGGWSLAASGGAPIAVPARKAKALLAFLAHPCGRRYPRETLAALLWPESGEAQARANLRQALKLARRALPSDMLINESDAVLLRGVETDAAAFEAALDAGAMERAAALYQGDFLAGFDLPSEPFREWARIESVRLRDRAADCLSRLVEELADRGDAEAAIRAAQRLLALDSLQESVHRRLIELYLEQGRRGLALAQYQTCRAMLEQELGLRPDPATEALLRLEPEPRVALPQPNPHDRAPPSIAVLPFADLGGEADHMWFREGLCEEIITALACWRCFPVIASSSTLTADERRPDARVIARHFGARYLVDGAIRRAGSRLRITVRLIDGASAHQLWAERYDMTLGDIFDVQEAAASRIASTLEPEVQRIEARRIHLKRTEDLCGWELWLRGLAALRLCTAEGNADARRCFSAALREDAAYSDAFTGLAKTHSQDALFRCTSDRSRSIARALEAGERAVALDPCSSDAHLVFAAANVWAGKMAVAIPETETAIDLNPSNAHARMSLGNRLDLIGESDRGVEEMEAGLRLNPHDPRRFNYMGFLARASTSLGKHEQALGWAEKAVRVRPDHPDMHYRHAICLANLDRIDEARDALALCETLKPGFLKGQAGWRPYSDPARNAAFFAGLDRHGLTH